ncbi:MAG: type II toxin-antitoxin system RelE/ParE family toxin [Candidatus Omnitrophica bacterium]|nr:type II toxin-antitoxin system RelE/ParE family toxin [Candidatus Omnitrophota bacterium]
MIREFRHNGLEPFFLRGTSSGIQANHAARLRLILGRLQASVSPLDMNPPGLRLHPLSGARKGTLSAILNRRAGISPQMSIRLAKAFGPSPESWLNQQVVYDPWTAEQNSRGLKVRKLSAA